MGPTRIVVSNSWHVNEQMKYFPSLMKRDATRFKVRAFLEKRKKEVWLHEWVAVIEQIHKKSVLSQQI